MRGKESLGQDEMIFTLLFAIFSFVASFILSIL